MTVQGEGIPSRNVVSRSSGNSKALPVRRGLVRATNMGGSDAIYIQGRIV